MDVVAVLGDPDMVMDAERIRRFQKRQTLERLILFGLLLVSFVSQLVLHVQVEELRADLNKEKQKVEDIIAAKDIVLNYHRRVETYELAKNSDSGKSRVQRTVNGNTPHFELTGSGESIGGVFTWNTRHLGAMFVQIPTSGDAMEIQIRETGIYRIDAEVAINGRNIQGGIGTRQLLRTISPAVCLYLMRKRGDTKEILRPSCLTQDQRGTSQYNADDLEPRRPHERRPYVLNKKYPLDTLTVHGQYLLEANDMIYIQRADDSINDPNNERYINNEQYAHFDAFKIA